MLMYLDVCEKKGETATTAQLLLSLKHATSPSRFALLRSALICHASRMFKYLNYICQRVWEHVKPSAPNMSPFPLSQSPPSPNIPRAHMNTSSLIKKSRDFLKVKKCRWRSEGPRKDMGPPTAHTITQCFRYQNWRY